MQESFGRSQRSQVDEAPWLLVGSDGSLTQSVLAAGACRAKGQVVVGPRRVRWKLRYVQASVED